MHQRRQWGNERHTRESQSALMSLALQASRFLAQFHQGLGSWVWFKWLYQQPCGSSSGGRVEWLITAGLLVRSPAPASRVSRCTWARHLTLTSPNELAVAVHGRLHGRRVDGWMSGNIVKLSGYKVHFALETIGHQNLCWTRHSFIFLFSIIIDGELKMMDGYGKTNCMAYPTSR